MLPYPIFMCCFFLLKPGTVFPTPVQFLNQKCFQHRTVSFSCHCDSLMVLFKEISPDYCKCGYATPHSYFFTVWWPLVQLNGVSLWPTATVLFTKPLRLTSVSSDTNRHSKHYHLSSNCPQIVKHNCSQACLSRFFLFLDDLNSVGEEPKTVVRNSSCIWVRFSQSHCVSSRWRARVLRRWTSQSFDIFRHALSQQI